MPVEIDELYQGAIPGARLTPIERSGHAVHMERPGAFPVGVLPFLVCDPVRGRSTVCPKAAV